MAVGEHYNTDAYDFIPRSFVMPWDYQQFQNYSKIVGKSGCYIAKPVDGSEGDNIILFRELKDWTQTQNNERVVQRYINNPFLVNKRKFDLRLYLLSTGINEGNMHGFLFDEGLARFCTEDYQKAEQKNFNKIYTHLTNSSINKHSRNYVDDVSPEQIFEPNNSTTRTLGALYKEIEQEHGVETVKTIKQNIQKVCEAAMTSMHNYILMFSNPYILSQQEHDVFIYIPFNIFGFDVMIDENLKAWLLEINSSPSMSYIICHGGPGCNHKNCTEYSPVNQIVKKNLVRDAFELLVQGKHVGLANLPDRHNTFQRVYPSQDPGLQIVDDGWRVMRHFFLIVSKGKKEFSQQGFVKVFCKSRFLWQQCGVRGTDLTILFQKVNGNNLIMYFFPFFRLMVMLKQKCQQYLGDGVKNVSDFVQLLQLI